MSANPMASAVPSRPVKAAPTQSSPSQNWLLAATRRVGACASLLLAKRGQNIEGLARIADDDSPVRTMSLVAVRALREKRVVVDIDVDDASIRQKSTTPAERWVCVGLSMRIGGRPAAVVFQIRALPGQANEEILRDVGGKVLRRVDDQVSGEATVPIGGIATAKPKLPAPMPLASKRTPERPTQPAKKEPSEPAAVSASKVAQLVAEQGALLANVASMVDQTNIDQSFHALANSVAQQFGCTRVSIGCRLGQKILLRAVSGVVDFDPRSALMVDLAEAMNEARLLACTTRLPDPDSEGVAPPGHASLAEQLNNPALISVPLVAHNSVIGAMLLERDRTFDDQEVNQLERLALLVSPVVELKLTDNLSAAQWLRRSLGRGLRQLFGARHAGLKFGVLCAALAVLLSATQTRMFRLDADAFIEARTQRAVVSSFPSFLRQVDARAGDIVQRGDVLAQLDVEDLQLERIKLEGEREKLVKEYRATLAQRDRSKVRVLEAKRSQVDAKLSLLGAQIDRATLRAPIDGAVISADLVQSLGRPVERGELLFEVASLEDYRLILRLDEKDIGWLEIGARGQIRLRSLANKTLPFEVTAIAPVSEPDAGANLFRVEATLDSYPESLRPGMAGVAKIDVEHRAVGWIWTRSFVDWFRMQLWKRGGL